MLVTKNCPHTGAVNLFFSGEPHLPVATIMKSANLKYFWWCHAVDSRGAGMGSGIATDLKTAKAQIADEFERVHYKH